MTDYSLRMPFNKNDMGTGWGATAFLAADVDGDGYDELVQPWKNTTRSNRLGMIVYNLKGSGAPGDAEAVFSDTFIEEGADAVAWLAGDIDGDGRDEVLQIWDSSGKTGVTVFNWIGPLNPTDGRMEKRGTSAFFKDGPGGSWLIADINGDGQAELIQMTGTWQKLLINVFRWTGDTLAPLCYNDRIGQGAGALRFLVGDVNGDKLPEIIQLWDNNGTLAMNVYGWVRSDSESGNIQFLSGSGNMGEGSGVLTWTTTLRDIFVVGTTSFIRNPAWLIGDIDGDGCAEIVQPWDNNGKPAMTVYRWDKANKCLVNRWRTVDLSPPGSLAESNDTSSWLIGDINLDNRAEIIRTWNNNGQLAISVFGWTGDAVQRVYLSAATTMGYKGIHFLCEKFRSPGRSNILQLWDNGNRLGMIQYGQDAVRKDCSFAPQFIVLSVRYAPPGNKNSANASQVRYLEGTSRSTMNSIRRFDGTSQSTSYSVNLAGSSHSDGYTTSSSTTQTHSFTIQHTQESTIAIGNPEIDGIDHNYDVFHIWLNPFVSATEIDKIEFLNSFLCREVRIGASSISKDGMYVAEVAAGYLNGSFANPPPQIAQLLDYLGPAARHQIMFTNPMLSTQVPPSQLARYQRLPIAFWYAAGLTPVTQTFKISTSKIKTDSQEVQTSLSVGAASAVGAAGGAWVTGGLSQEFTEQRTWTSTSIKERSVSTTELAECTIVSPSASYTGGGQLVVYWDKIYHTFMFDIT